MLLACGSNELQPSSIEEQPDGSFALFVECADAVSARVTETPDEVRIDRVRGSRVDGDCLGIRPLDLEAPIGDRRLSVNGERWMRIDADCDLAVYAHENVAEDWGWAVPQPCPSR